MRLKRALLLAAVISMAALTIAAPASAAVTCRVNVVGQWNTAYQASVDITNSGPDVVTDWYAILRFKDMETGIQQYWNATITGIGTAKTVTPPPWAETLGVGHTLSVGYIAMIVNGLDVPTCEVVVRNGPTTTTTRMITTTTTVPPTTTTTTAPPTTTTTTAPPTTTTTTAPPTTTTTTTRVTTTTRGHMEYSVSCRITNASVWDNGYQLEVTVTNNGMLMITGWQVWLQFSEAPGITNWWGTRLTINGNSVEARNATWNGNIPTRGTATFGIQGTHDGSFVVPQCLGSSPSSTTTTRAPIPN